MSRISHFSRILLLLTLALLPRLAQAQRIGPLGPTDRQQSKALSIERTAAPRPPSLQLSLPSPAAVALPPLGPNDLQRLQPQEGRPPLIGVHRRLPAGAVTRSFSGGGGQDDRRGSVAIDRGRTPLASKRSVRRDGRALSAMGRESIRNSQRGRAGSEGAPRQNPLPETPGGRVTQPIASEPAPSPRPWAWSTGATRPSTTTTLPLPLEPPGQNRTFLLGNE